LRPASGDLLELARRESDESGLVDLASDLLPTDAGLALLEDLLADLALGVDCRLEVLRDL
jgi:hypothetical protein